MLDMKIIKVVSLGAILTVLPGCQTLELKEASARVAIDLGFLKAEAEGKFEKKEDEQQRGFFPYYGMAAALSDIKIELSSQNSVIPNQSTLVTLIVKDGNSNVVAANTFVANVNSGTAVLANPGAVGGWLDTVAIPDKGSIAVSAPDIAIQPPTSGQYSATSAFVLGGQAVAQATATAYINDPVDPPPPTDPQRMI